MLAADRPATKKTVGATFIAAGVIAALRGLLISSSDLLARAGTEPYKAGRWSRYCVVDELNQCNREDFPKIAIGTLGRCYRGYRGHREWRTAGDTYSLFRYVLLTNSIWPRWCHVCRAGPPTSAHARPGYGAPLPRFKTAPLADPGNVSPLPFPGPRRPSP